MKFPIQIHLILVFFACGCQSQSTSIQYRLTTDEKILCNKFQFDTSIIQKIRLHNSNKIEPFHYSLGKIIEKDKEIEADPIFLNGLVFTEYNSRSYETVFALKDQFRAKGYSIFLLENNFNLHDRPDYVAVLKTTDKYTILKQVATDGINYEITNDSLITFIKALDKKYSLELIGASGDWCEFIIHKEPANWNKFAKEVYAVCPDVVDQGSGDITKFADEMQKTKRLYLWWD